MDSLETKTFQILWIGCSSNSKESSLEEETEISQSLQGVTLMGSLSLNKKKRQDFHAEMRKITILDLLGRSRQAFKINHIGRKQKSRMENLRSGLKVRYMTFDIGWYFEYYFRLD